MTAMMVLNKGDTLSTHSSKPLKIKPRADKVILILGLLLMVIGFLSVSSASFFLSQHLTQGAFYFITRQAIHVGLALGALLAAYLFPIRLLESLSPLILLVVICALALVMVPGIGKSVNGAYRWLSLQGINIQVSEASKLSLILYLSSYVQRKQILIQDQFKGALVPLGVMGVVAGLVLLEPDYGGAVIVLLIGLSMLFYAGLPWRYILVLLLTLILLFMALAYFSPYRMARLVAFFNPWENPYGDSYQLTQSLMAIGRGGVWGLGLGYGLQKQLYLPEAHTDFIYAVMAEEMGLVGSLMVLMVFILLVLRCFYWVFVASKKDLCFEAMVAFGVAVWWGISIIFSISVNLGLVPTKGIALPFLSYGGSNLLVNACCLGILLQITRRVSR